METYRKALLFATKAHSGQKRRNGNNYIVHPIRVSQEVKTEDQKVCALLHDVVEDTDVTHEDIFNNFGEHIAYVVGLLTHRKGESYDDYITRVLNHEDAVAVKIADICDNLSDSPSQNAINKSSRALERLVNHGESVKKYAIHHVLGENLNFEINCLDCKEMGKENKVIHRWCQGNPLCEQHYYGRL